MVWHEFFLHTNMGVVWEEGQDVENLSKKGCFHSFEW